MPKKIITNEQAIRTLLKDCDSFHVALLRERLQKISEITREAIKENPTSFDTFFVDHTYFLSLCDKIDQHLKLDD